jgi:hypothetical protein
MERGVTDLAQRERAIDAQIGDALEAARAAPPPAANPTPETDSNILRRETSCAP